MKKIFKYLMSQCVFIELWPMLSGTILCENKHTKEIGPLGGNWRGLGEAAVEDWNQDIPSPNYRSQVLERATEKVQSKRGEKAGNAISLARRDIFHFRSPTTHFHCKILSKKEGSSDSTAEGQPVISLSPTTDTRWRDTRIPWIGTLHHTKNILF